MPARFPSIPIVPQSGLSSDEVQFFNAIRESVGLLTGTIPESGQFNRAVTKGTISNIPTPSVTSTQLTSRAESVTITVSGNQTQVPSYTDYARLVTDVRNLAASIDGLQTSVRELITQLKA